MFELEDYSSSIHEGFFSKYADAAGPSLDFYVSDSMQDMLDVDIRAEIANVVGSSSDMTSLDHALEAISAINNSNNNNSNSLSLSTHNANANLLATSALHASPTAKWMGSCANFWSTADYYADIGACVNPISVMPLINSNSGSSSLLGSGSPQRTRGAHGASSAAATQGRAGSAGAGSVPPASPCDQHKSHLTFSPAQMKVSAGSMRREQVMAHIPKQISTLPMSSTSTTASTGSGNTAPASMASNSVLQRRNSPAVDAVRKDLGTELRKVQSHNEQDTKNTAKNHNNNNNNNSSSSNNNNNNSLLTTNGATSTIKLGPGIGGLTFANSATYNKLKQQTSVKSPNGSPLTSNGNILLKRDREASPLHATKRGSAPKSIASAAHSPHHQMQMQMQMQMQNSIGSPSSSSSSSSTNGRPANSSSPLSHSHNNSNNNSVVKPLQQKIKMPAAAMSSAFPKPAYSYSCLIALALKNSRAGSLPVSEIYSFLCQHFPYFENAPSGWKNSVRHNLSLNKCFEKIERPATNSNQRKGCRWAMNPERISKMDEEVQKWSRKDPAAIRGAMVYPEHLEALERGEMKHGSADSDVELDSQSEIEESSDLEEHDFDDTLIDAMLVEEEEENDDVDWANSEDEDQVQEEYGTSNHQSTNHLPNNHHQLLLSQKSADFDIEVDELYDAIEIEDDKQAVRGQSTQNSIIELNPADLNVNDGYQSPKRARLDINYAIGPAGELEQQYGQKVKVQQVQQLQQVIQQQPPTYNRRKMPLVNRII